MAKHPLTMINPFNTPEWKKGPFPESIYEDLRENVSAYNSKSESLYELETEEFGLIIVRPVTEPWALWHIDTFRGMAPPEDDRFLEFLNKYVVAPDFSGWDESDLNDMLAGYPRFFARIVGEATKKYYDENGEDPVIPYLQ